MQYLWFLMALISGAAISTQSGVNSQLREVVRVPVFAAFISFAVGTAALLLILLFTGQFSQIQSVSNYSSIKWWKWTGGFLGAYMVSSAIIVSPKIGVANMMAFVVAGQIFTAIVFDHFGVLGFSIHTISPLRIIGALLLILGVYLILKF